MDEKIAAVKYEIEAVERNIHPDLTDILSKTAKTKENRIQIAQKRKFYEEHAIMESFKCSVGTANNEYLIAMHELRMKLASKVLPNPQCIRNVTWAPSLSELDANVSDCLLVYKNLLSDAQISDDLKRITQ